MQNCGKLTFVEDANLWEIESTPDVLMRLKRIFPRANQARACSLTIGHTSEVANDLEWVLQRFPMSVEGGRLLRSSARHYRKTIERAQQLMTTPEAGRKFDLALPLRDYQSLATNLLLEQGRLLNADHIGLGKTATAIAAFTDSRTLPALVVVQAHLPQQWEEEIQKFIPSARTHIVRSTSVYDLPASDVYIISYSKLSAWADVFSKFVRLVVFDEIQELRCLGTKKYKAAEIVSSAAAFRFGLSATPVTNYGGEIWSIMNILAPDALGRLHEFETEHCRGPANNGKRIVADPDTLGHYLRSNFLMIRRSRKDVGRELPPVTRFVQEVDFDENTYSNAVGAAEELAKLILQGSFMERGQASRMFDNLVRQATGVAKAPYVAEFVRMLLESGEKVMLGAWHHSVWDIYRDRLKEFNPVMFTGEQSPTQKRAAREAFISGKSNLLCLSLRSGAGTNGFQDVCSVGVIGELDWSPKVIDQWIGRISRDGQKEPCQIFFPIARGGSDPIVAGILGLKSAQASGIVDLGQDVDVDEIDLDPDRIKELARDFLSRRGVKVAEPAATRSA